METMKGLEQWGGILKIMRKRENCQNTSLYIKKKEFKKQTKLHSEKYNVTFLLNTPELKKY